MAHPAFFDRVPRITLYDPLAEFLGAAEDGLLEYGYADAVRLAGHSCPTVAMAYALTVKGLQALFPGRIPERGSVLARFPEPAAAGVTGVVSAVVGLLTGATEHTGFKGIGGRFARHGLMDFAFGATLPCAFRLEGSGRRVDLSARLDRVPAPAALRELLPLCAGGRADPAQQDAFRALWQGRVQALLVDHWDDAELWQVCPQ